MTTENKNICLIKYGYIKTLFYFADKFKKNIVKGEVDEELFGPVKSSLPPRSAIITRDYLNIVRYVKFVAHCFVLLFNIITDSLFKN